MVKGKNKPTKKVHEKNARNENILLRNVFIILSVLIIVIFGTYYYIYNSYNFNYNGLKFDTLNENGILFYHTSFPTVLDGRNVNYNVYIRNDPRKLQKEVPFAGKINVPEIFVFNATESFSCEGDGGISSFNLQQVLKAFGTNMITDQNATCDPYGRYGILKVQSGNISAVGQFGPACYLLQVNNCEILKVTERFLVEVLVKQVGEEEA